MSLPITPDHIFEVPSVSQPHLSADGSTLAFVKTTIDRSTMERKSHIVVSRSPFDELSALTDGPSDTAPVIDGGPSPVPPTLTTAATSRSGRFPWTAASHSVSPTSLAAWKNSLFHRTATASPPFHPSIPTRPTMKIPACRVSESCGASAIATTTADSPATPSGRCSWLMWSQGAPAKSRTARGTTGRPCGRRTASRLPSSPTTSRGATSPPIRRSRSSPSPTASRSRGRKLSPTSGRSRGRRTASRSSPSDATTKRCGTQGQPGSTSSIRAGVFAGSRTASTPPSPSAAWCGLRNVASHSSEPIAASISCAPSVPTAADSRPSRAEV